MTAGAAGLVLSNVGRSPARHPGSDPARDFDSFANEGPEPLFGISLAEWSLHKALYDGELDHLDFPRVARREFGIDAIEFVNSFFKDKALDQGYLLTLKDRCETEGVRSLLIMCDGEGRLGDPNDSARTTAVENHYRWVEAARLLGCHSIRVNAASEGSWDEQRDLAADGLHRLAEFAAGYGIFVIVENHGGLSSNGRWLSSVIEAGDHPRLGTLPDFGNFRISESERYDNYRGVEQMMPYARAVSAKTNDFDPDGEEVNLDYEQLIRIVLDSGYRGWIGIEYEGVRLPEPEGIRRTKALLERVREKLTPEYS
ncbi:MAG: sugar phosphate isomerase/epimerase [Gemmatimonadetes bacterium]|nr:sugar phosphate isomerase/epimerase [Gemmatimonadota bacterium]